MKVPSGAGIHMQKWWAKYMFQSGRVTRHLSPNEQYPVRSLIKTMPEKTLRKITENAPVLIPSFLLLIGTAQWGYKKNDEVHREHWS